MQALAEQKPALLKLDFGCGKNKREGFIGVDCIAFEGVDVVCQLGNETWPWDDNSIEEGHASHFVEHLDATQRCHFFNELHRVLIPGGKCTIIVPHWGSCRAYGDPTHQWPPIGEFFFYYLSKEWRLGKDGQPGNAPHTDNTYWHLGYACDFDATWSYNLHPSLVSRNQEFQQFAVNFYREGAQDIIATVTKRA